MGRAEELRFTNLGDELVGTLHLPDGPGPHPAVLMLQGSGPADRDGNGYFPPIRAQLVGHGVAAFSFDKPGIGASSGDWRFRTIQQRAEQALDALALLCAHPAIDPARVGLWGQSQGGWITPLVVARAAPGAVAFAIPQSCPGIDVAAQDAYAIEHLLRDWGYGDAVVQAALAHLAAMQAAALRGDPWELAEPALFAPVRGAEWFQRLGLAEYGPEDWAAAILWAAHPYHPAPALERVRCPLLAIFGELDLLLPVAESVAVFQRCLATNEDTTIRVFPGANHRLQIDPTGDFAPGYLKLLTDWLLPRVGLA